MEEKFCSTPSTLAFAIAFTAAASVAAVSDDNIKWTNSLLAFVIFFVIIYAIIKYLTFKNKINTSLSK